jgi:hypothetical protein
MSSGTITLDAISGSIVNCATLYACCLCFNICSFARIFLVARASTKPIRISLQKILVTEAAVHNGNCYPTVSFHQHT